MRSAMKFHCVCQQESLCTQKTKTRRPILKRLLPIVETPATQHEAGYEKDGLFFDSLSPELNDILGVHREVKIPHLRMQTTFRAIMTSYVVKEESPMQRRFLDSKSLKWTKVGEGSTCTVWQVSLQSGQFIGIKRIIDERRLLPKYTELKQNAVTLLSLRHTNLMSYLGFGYDTHSVCMCVEFIQGETLHSIINRFGPLRDEKSSHYTRQIVQGLEYLHNKTIAHRNVRAAKVMVTPKDVAKLIDLLSLKIEVSSPAIFPPDVHLSAPETVDPTQVGPGPIDYKKLDIWSLGCTVHEMATSYPPWANSGFKSTFDLLNNIVQGNPIPPLPDSVSTEITSFIFRCLVYDPAKRPGASELLEDAFLAVNSKPTTDERAQEIIDEAMESGSLQQRNVVGLITGLMGSGKTTLLHDLFGLAPPGLYTSTGVAEQSFRGLLHHILRISAGVWRRLSYRDIREVLAFLMQAGMKETDIHFLAACLMRDIEPVEETLDSSSTIAAPASSSTNPTLSVPTASLPQVEKSPSCQKMIPLVKSTAPSHPTEELLLLELVHMIDTGGQPELMEVMPSLIHNANLALVLVNLQVWSQ
ncbi:Mitogen-activated protein kinase kinase kinase 19 [Geodia barretti]|uniref:Mitogen-activated protein kinase kinase kinase 19 n=1 Tax=Geodia barretti TaxID=519541 RepID=A0AA35S8L7_GEOBA|nr:Mitogen-activated protein kinase kinase kinase 19 [Geodia barretti]